MPGVIRIISRLTHSPRGAGVKVHYRGKAQCSDGAANIYTAKIMDDGFASIIKVLKTAPTGIETELEDVIPPEGKKAVGVALMVSGANLHIGYTADHGDFDTIDVEEVRTNYVIPYGPSGPELGMAGAFVPSGAPEPTPEPTPTITVEEIMSAMRAEFGGNIRQGLQDKARDGVKALSASLQARGLDRWLMDRVFECLTTNWPDQFPMPDQPSEQPDLGEPTETLVEGD